MPVRVVRWRDAAEVPWKNGGGITRELVVQGADPFHWRLSAATIDSDGPFSEFVGIDRVLVLLRGSGMLLDIDGSPVRLESPGAGVAFSGEAGVTSALLDGPTVDLNLMWRRDLYAATWQVGRVEEVSTDGGAATAPDVTVVHVLDGEVGVDGVGLTVGDSAWWNAADASPACTGHGVVVRLGLTRLH